ncbi:hypothetical protein Emed_004191 [Eimeria media]
MAAALPATAAMESPLLPTPRSHTHTIIPHGHTRRVPVEAACRVMEIPQSLLCCCQNTPSQSNTTAEHAAPEPLAEGPQEVAAVQPAQTKPLEKSVKKKSVEFEDEPIPVAITFLPKKETTPRRSASVSSDEHSEILSADGAEAQPTRSWLRCCDTSYVDEPQDEAEPEEVAPPLPVECSASPRTEDHLEPPQSAQEVSCWSPGICGTCSRPGHESISTYTEESLPQLEHAPAEYPEESQLPVVYAPVEYPEEQQTQVVHKRVGPEEVEAVASPEKVVKRDLIQDAAKPRGKHVVYIDHYPEGFVKSYFGDDESEQIPDNYTDFRFNKATEVLFAAGTALGVVVTGGAVVLGGAALTAGLTVGIAATELYKRVTNNYNI